MKKVMLVFGTRPETIKMCSLVREFWKQMSRIRIKREKASEKERLAVLQILVEEDLN